MIKFVEYFLRFKISRFPSKAGTYVREDGSHSLMYLYNPETHCCGQDCIAVIKQDFKNSVKKVMSEDPRAKFGKVIT